MPGEWGGVGVSINMRTVNRIAVNTTIQYIKLIINVLLGLITVRVLLNALGVEDYGIYDVVGGVVALLSFINSSLSQSSVRFISVSLGKNNINETRSVFNNCFWIHLIVSIGIVILLEIVGYLFLDVVITVPDAKLNSAKMVFHFMMITLFLQVAITPFNALIVSHEKFVFTASIAILDSILKLVIALIIRYYSHDKLILYGFLMAVITIINSILSVGYVYFSRHKEEAYIGRFSFKNIRELVKFVGWTIMDVLSQLFTKQGYSVILNKFFGPATNAVYAISRQIEGNFYYLSASVIDSIKPQIMKSYGEGNNERMLRLSLSAGKMGFAMISLIAIPILVMMPTVLKIWLGRIPEGLVFFSRIMVISCMTEQITRGLVYSCQAIGNIRLFTMIVSLIRICALPLSIICFICGASSSSSIIVYLICEATGSFARVVIMSKITSLTIKTFIKSTIFRIVPPLFIAIPLCFILYSYDSTIINCIVNLVFTCTLYIFLVYSISFDKTEKEIIKKIYKSFIEKIKK